MKKRTCAVVLLSLGWLGGCAQTPGGGGTTDGESGTASQQTTTASQSQRGPSDATITTTIKEAFQKDEMLSSQTINVSTEQGVVTLGGRVANGRVMNRAISLARSVPGVRRVNSQLDLP